jgi:hypothetical protein
VAHLAGKGTSTLEMTFLEDGAGGKMLSNAMMVGISACKLEA